MPTYDPRARYPAGNVRLSIPSLSGGVGRQAPTKRAVNEAENIDNALVTLERSVEKRAPMEFIRRYTGADFNTLDADPLSQLDIGTTDGNADIFFHWFSVSDSQRYLCVIDYSSTNAATYFNIYRTTAQGFYKCDIDASAMHTYMTYGYSLGLPMKLKAITIGPQLIVLNSNVYCGYSSTYDATNDQYTKIDMGGNFAGSTEDIEGRKIEYMTSVPVDDRGQASFFVNSKFYIKNDQVIADNGSGAIKIYTCVQEGEAKRNPQAWINTGSQPIEEAGWALRAAADGGEDAIYIPVEDWDYPESSKAYLGQALEDFSEFQFPPRASDVDDGNSGNGTEAQATLAALYPDELGSGQNGRTASGRGKVYNVENSYAGEPPGFYIIRNATSKPYVMLVRSPFEHSVIDRARFPKIIKVTTTVDLTATPTPITKEVFNIQNFELEHRTSGNLNTNPGPAAWKEGLQAPIQSMAFFRDRLFLSVGDNVFSSRTGDFSDFWVEDPSTVQETDPIDVRLSTNKFAPVSTMTPFQQYLFINTESDIQFTLQGSENKISPLNSEVSPTAFYSTSPLVDPILLGSQIYFFAPRRTYIYFNDATVSVNQAIETSLNCPDYLPTNYGAVKVVPGYDSIIMLDKDNPKMMYVYTNRYSGGKVSQNAFFRYVFRVDIDFIESFDNDMYFVTKQPTGDGGAAWNLGFMPFREEDYAVPLLDQWVYVGGAADEGSVVYDINTDVTTLTIPNYFNLNPEFLYIVPQEVDPQSGETYTLDPNRVTSVNGTVTIAYDGDITFTGRRYVVGTSYTMTVELSPQYMRDDNQNMVEGIVSLRTMSTQHFNSGSYRVEKDINGRRSTSMTFSPQELDALQHTSGFDVPLPLYEGKGETFSKIMGFSCDTSIYIVSDYAGPVNITQIELKGKFTGKSSGFVR